MHIRIIVGVPGSGKTELLISEMATNPARYLVAYPTMRLISEAEKRINAAAKAAGTSPVVVTVHSRKKAKFPVAEAISALPTIHTGEHVVVLVTHQGMMDADLNGFEGWTLVIDELPASVLNGSMPIPVTSRVLDEVYTLTPVGDGWYRVGVKEDALGNADADEFFRKSPFHRRARQGRLFIDVPGFAALVGDRTAVNWYAAWTLDEVAAFDRVTIAGASVLDSLLLRTATGIDLEVKDISPVRTAKPHIIIRYYADQHGGSSTFWQTELGQTCLSAVAADLAERDIAYWSCNDVITADLAEVGGRKVPPKMAGSNILRQMESCAFIYSAKALLTDIALRSVYGLTKDDIKRQRETEDVWQFAWRGAIRNPDFGGRYVVYLYDHEQATTLATMFASVGITAELELIETAATSVVRERAKPGPTPIGDAPMSAAERKRNQRARERKIKEARASFGGLA